MIAALIQDVRFALRQMRKSPGFAATAVTVLALGLGANIAVFTLINGIFLRPLPYADAGRIVAITAPGSNGFNTDLSYSNDKQLIDAMGTKVQTGVMFAQAAASVVAPGGRYQVIDEQVSASLTQMLGVQPMLGRSFFPEENDPGREHVVLLSEPAWRELFAADPHVIGQTLSIKSQPYTVIGVMPKGFSFPFDDALRLWTPAAIDAVTRTAMDGENLVWGNLYAKLPEGMTAAQLAANLNLAQARIAKESANTGIPVKLSVSDYRSSMNQYIRKPLGLLYAVVLGVWAIASLNVTSLLLARAVIRGRELAVRAALGASRGRLLQQSIVESLLLSGIGAALGLAIGELTIKLLWFRIAKTLPMANAIHVEWRVIAGLALLTLTTALMVGIFPALWAARRDVQGNLAGANSTASAQQNHAREVLVVAQLALTLAFLAGAGLFLRTIHNLRQIPLGFREQNVLTGGIILNGNASPRAVDKTVNIVQTSYLPLLEKVRAIGGVKEAALSSVLPMRPEFSVSLQATLDHNEKRDNPKADGRLASAGLVEALGIPMIRGRFFLESDSLTSPVVVVVNQAFANKYLAGTDPIGHVIAMGKGRFGEAHIVGVIGDMKQADLKQRTKPEMYFCLAQMGPGTPLYFIATAFMQVAIRGAIPADLLRARFDTALHEVAPDATTTDVKTIQEAVEDSFGSQTMTSYLLAGFAGLALLIASVGLYGLLSFAVAQRTREIGLRLALGAQRGNILRLVLSRALLLVTAGLGLGIALAWFAVSLARSYIFGVEAHDGVTFVAVSVLLAATSLLAALIPARQAASIEPMVALRSE